jgi:hypothetical protein
MRRPRFSLRERTSGTHCTGCCVGLRAGVDTDAKGKNRCLCRGSKVDRPVVQPVARHYTDWATELTYLLFLPFFPACDIISEKWKDYDDIRTLRTTRQCFCLLQTEEVYLHQRPSNASSKKMFQACRQSLLIGNNWFQRAKTPRMKLYGPQVKWTPRC